MKALYLVAALTLAATALLFVSSPSSPHADFEAFKARYSKQYSPAENMVRMNNYLRFLAKMEKHNSDPTKTWKMGINQFSDLAQEEFVLNYLGEKSGMPNHKVEDTITVGDVDWRSKNVITSIKNQGKCGSCWAFASTAAHETYQVMNNKQPIDLALSPQQLVDCSGISPYGNEGCNGGYAMHGLEYIKDFGQTTESSYPYQAQTQTCKFNGGDYNIRGVVEITGCSNMETTLVGRPMAVRVDASNWHNYASGIFNDCQKNLNHAVFLVGSSATSWTIKNSWSATWGEEGYIRLAKGDTCGVCTGPSFPF